MKFLFVFIALFLILGCQSTPKCGPEIRAAFDIGSGSTKMKVAEVNTCTATVSRVVFEDQVKVDYRDALEKNSAGDFSAEIQQEGLAALGRLKSEAQAKGARKFAGIATAAFRQAKNASVLIGTFKDTLGIPVRVISQSEEAMYGFQSAVAQGKVAASDVLVWDIGGGSQQMVTLNEKAEPIIYEGQLASVSFKNFIIASVQKKDPKKVFSPNPLKKAHVKTAIDYVETAAKSGTPGAMYMKANQHKNLVVFGIGGVLTKSVPGQIAAAGGEGMQVRLDQAAVPAPVSITEIKKALDKRVGLTDKQIGTAYAETDVSNLVLVYGFMKAMGLKEYKPVDISLVDGLWFNEGLWY